MDAQRGGAKKWVRVPNGYATAAKAYCPFLEHNGLVDLIRDTLATIKEGRRL